jgi:hypothetical protein
VVDGREVEGVRGRVSRVGIVTNRRVHTMQCASIFYTMQVQPMRDMGE